MTKCCSDVTVRHIADAVASAPCWVAKKLGDLKATLSGSDVIPCAQHSVKISQRRDPNVFYQTRPGLNVFSGFPHRVVSHAETIDVGISFTVSEHMLRESLFDKRIETRLPRPYCFSESAACAFMAELLDSDRLDWRLSYILYLNSCVMSVNRDYSGKHWNVAPWDRNRYRWRTGNRVLAPA